MAGFSFIHAADIHLGSTIQLPQVDISKQQQELLAEANYTAFASLVETAIAEEVDFLLLAGDVYDKQQRSIQANQFFNQQCERLAKHSIPVYIIAGNHDSLNSRSNLFSPPDNVVEFGYQTVEQYQISAAEETRANLLGQSYQYPTEQNPLHLEYESNYEYLFNIALLHTQLEAEQSNYIPATKQELKENSSVDYWALGHIHQCQIEHSTDPVIAYPGIPQGRDFGEQNLGGCLLVEVQKTQQVNYKFVPTANFVWQRREINLNNQAQEFNNLEQLAELIQGQAKELAESYPDIPAGLTALNEKWKNNFIAYLVEWKITGAGEIDQVLTAQPEEAAASLKERMNNLDYVPNQVLTAGFEFDTRPPLPSLKELKSNNQVFAELSQILTLYASGLETELKSKLGDIWQEEVDHENIDPTRFQLNSQTYQKILEQAKNLIIEELMERRD